MRVLFALEGNQEVKKARKIVLAGKVEEILKVYLRVKQEETRALNNQCVNLCARPQEMGKDLMNTSRLDTAMKVTEARELKKGVTMS